MIRAHILHAQVLAALHAAAFPEEPWSVENFTSLLVQPTVFAWLDERGGFLLLRIAADEAEILTLGTVHRRQGIARTLLETAINHAKQAGVDKIFLEVAEQNEAAKALYAAFGFTQRGRRPNYYAHGDSALILGFECYTNGPKD